MCATKKSLFIAAEMRNADDRSIKRMRLYPEVVDYLLKKVAADEAIAEFLAGILQYVKQTNKMPR